MSINPSNTWARFYFELHASAMRLRELMDRLATDTPQPTPAPQSAKSKTKRGRNVSKTN